MHELSSSTARATVDEGLGGRLASLEVGGTQLIVGRTGPGGMHRGAFDWGVYPMVPFAGRVRNGRFDFRGTSHRLPLRMPPHAIHGTVNDVSWRVIESQSGNIRMETDLGADWPFRGRVFHSVTLGDGAVRFELVLTAEDAMPAQVGWHPWFERPAVVGDVFAGWLPRDDDGMPGMPTTEGVPLMSSVVDDCFLPGEEPIPVTVNGMGLSLSSDCSHWVVYSGAAHGVCVEPQSGPPNATESGPVVLDAGESLRRWFEISWHA